MERLVLVHGSVRNGDFAWAGQHELAEHVELNILNRPGFPPNPPEERIDFEETANGSPNGYGLGITCAGTRMAPS
jgi:hypothetical protein